MIYNNKRYSTSLSEMIAIPTISCSDEVPTTNISEFHKYLHTRYPLISQKCIWSDFNGGLMIRLKGSNSEKPLALMSHLDVVSATDDWDIPAFNGTIKDGKIYGRGSADTKGSLCAIFEAVEQLIDSGVVLTQDLYILSSSREEVAGQDAVSMSEYFVSNGIAPALLIDEGGAVMDKPMNGVSGEYALMAMSERASCKLQLLGETRNIEKLKKLLAKKKLVPNVLPCEVAEMFKRMSKTMTLPMKLLFGNLWLTKGLIVNLLPKISSQAGAMVKPTVTFKQDNNMEICNVACTYYHNILRVVQSINMLAQKCNVTTKQLILRDCPQPTNFNSSGVKLVENVIRKVMPTVTPTPFIIFGGTDARHFVNVADCVVRFAPLRMNNEIVASVHNKNEYIYEQSIADAVEFYKQLVTDFNEQTFD